MTRSIVAGVRWFADGLLAPFVVLPDPMGLVFLSVVLGLLLLILFRALTPQRRVRALRDQMAAAVYEMRLFLDSPRLVLRAQARLVRLNLRYLALVTPALLVAVLTAGLLLWRADAAFGDRPLAVGEPALLRVVLADPPRRDTIRVESSDGVDVLPPLVVLPARREVWTRVRPTRAGLQSLSVRAGSGSVDKRLAAFVAGRPPVALVPTSRTRVTDPGWLSSHEPPLPEESGVLRIDVDHPPRDRLLPWWLTVLLVSMLAALTLRRPLGVTL